MVVDPFQLLLDGLRGMGGGSQHPETPGAAHGCDHVAAVAEGKQRKFDAQHVANRRFHRVSIPCVSRRSRLVRIFLTNASASAIVMPSHVVLSLALWCGGGMLVRSKTKKLEGARPACRPCQPCQAAITLPATLPATSSWSARDLPECICSTGCVGLDLGCASTSRAGTSAAPGTGTAIPARVATSRACSTPIPFPTNCSRNGTGAN